MTRPNRRLTRTTLTSATRATRAVGERSRRGARAEFRDEGRARGWRGLLWLTIVLAWAAGCVVVPQNRRKHLADPMMSLEGDALETHKRQKFYSTREGAAGADGLPAGGGCGCQ
jgi:hypothetical protein